jgi:hypothetical protein
MTLKSASTGWSRFVPSRFVSKREPPIFAEPDLMCGCLFSHTHECKYWYGFELEPLENEDD